MAKSDPERDHRIRQLVYRDGLSYRQARRAVCQERPEWAAVTPSCVAGVLHRTTAVQKAAACMADTTS